MAVILTEKLPALQAACCVLIKITFLYLSDSKDQIQSKKGISHTSLGL